ncbi:MAG: hypothetical protein ACXVL8_10420 [Acidimicrobiia bacterium]
MSSLVPAASEGTDLPVSLDDLLPSTAPRDRAPRVEPAPEPPAPTPPEPPHPPTADEIAEIERLHNEVNEASEAAERAAFGGKGRKRLRAALQAEDDALRALGFASHAEFVYATRSGGAPPRRDELWGLTEAAMRATPPEVAPPAGVSEPQTDAAAAEVAPATRDSELDEARIELVQAQGELQRVRAELAETQAAREAADEAEARTRSELDERATLHQQAHADAEVARRQLTEAQAELQRIRTESEQEIEQMRTLATAEVEELAAQLTAYREETDRAADENAERERGEIERLRAELQQAQQLASSASAEVNDATRSRDAAIDELALHRTEIDKLRGELGRARADHNRLKSELDAAVARAAEAEAAAGAGQEGSERDLAQTREQLDAAHAEVAAALDANAQLTTQLESARREVETARDETDAARVETDVIRAELTELQNTVQELEQRTAPEAPGDATTVELERLVELAASLAGDSRRPGSDAPATDPGGTSGAHGTSADLARARRAAERELEDLEARVALLRTKRRRAKHRLAEARDRLRDERETLERTLAWTADEVARRRDEVREAEALRDRVRAEAEAIAARIAAEAATMRDDAVRQRRETEQGLHDGIEQASAELAALEAGVESVAVDAGALRSKLASIRAALSGIPVVAPPSTEAGSTDVD